jgi:ubiquinone/menaquinone biosynthesis C-methylase UbiE
VKFDYWAMDYSMSGLKSAQQRLRRLGLENEVRLVAGDMLELPFGEGGFDVVVCPSVIEHLPAQRRACEEMLRVCKKGGVVVVSTDNKLGYVARTGISSVFALGGRVLRKMGVLKTPQGYFVAHTESSFCRLSEGLPVAKIEFKFTHFGVIGFRRWIGWIGRRASEKRVLGILERVRRISARRFGFSHAMFIATIVKR